MVNMYKRRGEQLGWKPGWMGGFIWVAALALLFAWQEHWWASATGFLLTGRIVNCRLN
jgi:hypothetical protein